MKFLHRTTLALMLTAVGCFSSAQAGIQLVGTRVIYPAGEREVTVRMNNKGEAPRMVQAWIDDGDSKASAEAAKAPFLLTPPLSRVEPGKGQTLRIMFTGGDVPQDRESVYWLNVLEIPPKVTDTRNMLQFAVRTRVKIFYRPEGLAGDAASAIQKVSWRLIRKDGGMALECTNATPYNVSIAGVGFKGTSLADTMGRGGLCPAMGRESFPVEGGTDSGRLAYRAIDDYGAFVDGEAAYTR